MLDRIGDPKHIPSVIARAKDKNDTFRLMGFGHRIYKNFDPRAQILRDMCHRVLKEIGAENVPLFETALELERVALNDPYFVERKLYPNVDFYSGIILKSIGIPLNMFTVIFAMARTVGWVAQWTEMMGEPDRRIGRPRQLYVGSSRRDYVSIRERS